MTVTLTEWLRSCSPEQLTSLLSARPEAGAPPQPRNLAELADRLTIPNAIVAALHRLPTPAIQIIEVLQLLGPGGGDRATLVSWLGCEPDHPGLTATLATLTTRALVWPDGRTEDSLQLAKPLYQAFRFPLGLGSPAGTLLARYSVEQLRPIARTLQVASHGRRADLIGAITGLLCDPEQVRALVARATPQTRARLQALADDGPDHPTEWYGYQAAPDPALRWAAERGLVVTDSWGVTQPPREVAIALRGSGWHVPFVPRRPDPPLTDVPPEAVTREAAAAGSGAADQLASLLAAIETAPVSLLKSGGVGVKELRRLARTTGLTEPVVRLWLELAYEAELVGVVPDRAGGGELLPTNGYDQWAALEPADQLATILPVWAALPASPMGGPAAGESKPAPALVRDQGGQFAVLVRQQLLGLVSTLPAGRAVADEARLVDTLGWLSPLVASDPDAGRLVAAAWREAQLVGVVTLGAYSPLCEALTSGEPDRLAETCRALLPAAAEAAVFQADLTALVPGTPARALAELLDAAADRESGGGAVTWRFSPGSVRRALDTGQAPDQLLAALRERAVGQTLPQPLAYLVNDVARRHGAIRVRAANCVLRVDDEALAAELAGARALRSLQLALVAPTVLTAATPVEQALSALRAAGYAPVAESADGVTQLSPRQPRRAGGGRRRRIDPASPVLPDPKVLADQLLAAPLPRQAPVPAAELDEPPDPDEPDDYPPGEHLPDELRYEPPDVAAELAERAGHLAAGEQRLLAYAIETQQPVMISYTNAQGNRTTRTIDTAELIGPHLVAWCQLRDDERMFALHRIDSVAPAP